MLTEDVTSIIGTTKNDLITGTTDELTADHRITDVSTTDNDIFNLTAKNSDVAMDVTNIEKINIDWNAYGTPDFDLANVRGANVKISSEKAGYLGNAKFDNVDRNDITIGTGVTGTVTVNKSVDSTIEAGNAKTLVVTNANRDLTINANDTETVTIAAATNDVDNLTLSATKATDVTVEASRDASVTFGKNADVTVKGTADYTLQSTADVQLDIAAGAAYKTLTVAGDNEVTLSFENFADVDGQEIINAGTVIIEDTLTATGTDSDFSKIDAKTFVLEAAQAAAEIKTVTGSNFVLEKAVTGVVAFETDTTSTKTDAITVTTKGATAGTGLKFDEATKEFETVTIVSDAKVIANTASTINYDSTYNAITAGTSKVILQSAVNDVDVTAIKAKEVDASAVVNEFKMIQAAGSADMMVVGGQSKNDVTFTGVADDSTFIATAEDADDKVTFVNTAGEAVAILNGGNNTVSATGVIAGLGQLTVVAGSGDDKVTANAATTGTLSINLGDGKNTFSATALTTGTVEYTGGTGVDDVTVTFATTAGGKATLNLGDGDNKATIDASANTVVSTIDITAGAGDDLVTLTTHASTNGKDVITMDLGEGTNTLAINAVTSDLDLTLVNVDVIAVGANGAAADVDASLLNGAAYEITGQGTAGATDTLNVTMKTTLDDVDFSGITINDTLTKGIAGLNIKATSDNNTIVATAGADTIDVVGGDNTVTGGKGADTITLGGGIDTVVIADGDSGATFTTSDTIDKFKTAGADKLSLGTAATSTNFLATDGDIGTGADNTAFDAALAAANGGHLDGTIMYAYYTNTNATNNSEAYLFVDYNLDGTADAAINLVGLTAGGTTLAAADIIA